MKNVSKENIPCKSFFFVFFLKRASCYVDKMRGKLLKEKLELLQGKNLCPWCLKHGQMNDGYKEKCCWQ